MSLEVVLTDGRTTVHLKTYCPCCIAVGAAIKPIHNLATENSAGNTTLVTATTTTINDLTDWSLLATKLSRPCDRVVVVGLSLRVLCRLPVRRQSDALRFRRRGRRWRRRFPGVS